MMELKVLVVDDEPLLCNEMKNILESCCGLDQVLVCHDGIQALQVIEREKIDLVFLDIQMPGITGIEVARIWSNKQDPPIVVFVTAHSEYALNAFGVDALDYILKPFDEEDIRRVLNKIEKHHGARLSAGIAPGFSDRLKKTKYPGRFVVDGRNGMEVVEALNILMIEAQDRLVFLHTMAGNKYTARLSLQQFEEKLDSAIFYRCHRNYIVNVSRIRRIIPFVNRGYALILVGSNEIQVPVSRTHATGLKQYFQF